MIEINGSKPKAIDFTYNGDSLFIRKMPLRLGLKFQGAVEGESEVPAEIVAGAIRECVVDERGERVFASTDDVLDMDTAVMLKLFSKVSLVSFSLEDAVKN